jgi:transcriptional regulator with GAF, ATPase, and Fis domain
LIEVWQLKLAIAPISLVSQSSYTLRNLRFFGNERELMPDINKPVAMFASTGDREDILDEAQNEALEALRKILIEATSFFDNYSSLNEAEQLNSKEEKDRMIALMKRHIRYT